MIELTPFAGLLAGAGNLYLMLALVTTFLNLWKARTWQRKLGWAALVLALFAAPLVPNIYRGVDYRIRYAKAKAMFDERCKTAGEKVSRKVMGVEGVLLTKSRPTEVNAGDQYRMDDPFGSDCHGEECIVELLRVSALGNAIAQALEAAKLYQRVKAAPIRDYKAADLGLSLPGLEQGGTGAAPDPAAQAKLQKTAYTYNSPGFARPIPVGGVSRWSGNASNEEVFLCAA